MTWRSDSLETKVTLSFGLCLLLQLICTGFLLSVLPLWQVAGLAILIFSLLLLIFKRLYRQLFASFRRASVQLEALQQQDYSLFAKPAFSQGKVAEFHQQLNDLGAALQEHKSHYDQQQFVLYRLIDQLNTPIVVFDARQQLSYANNAFADLFGRPWQTQRHASPALLGLSPEPEWHFVDAQKMQQWQIRTSRFFDQGASHQLLVFINIQSALRESQLAAWQQLIRVLSHEIRNSLTPVAALTQNLQTKVTGEREQQALELIGERCQHLQDFVSRYAQLHKPLQVELQWLTTQILIQRLEGLFPNIQIQTKSVPQRLWCDPVLILQVLINLIKNALEAGSPSIEIVFNRREQQQEILLVDRGQGIAKPENLFVPFYSTKSLGQGIGLSLSRHIVEQMGGQLSLKNNVEGGGACAQIYLVSPVVT
jgi:two-component system, NtrC family, nitrogen regulation sensor histidine kinase NtrY